MSLTTPAAGQPACVCCRAGYRLTWAADDTGMRCGDRWRDGFIPLPHSHSHWLLLLLLQTMAAQIESISAERLYTYWSHSHAAQLPKEFSRAPASRALPLLTCSVHAIAAQHSTARAPSPQSARRIAGGLQQHTCQHNACMDVRHDALSVGRNRLLQAAHSLLPQRSHRSQHCLHASVRGEMPRAVILLSGMGPIAPINRLRPVTHICGHHASLAQESWARFALCQQAGCRCTLQHQLWSYSLLLPRSLHTCRAGPKDLRFC